MVNKKNKYLFYSAKKTYQEYSRLFTLRALQVQIKYTGFGIQRTAIILSLMFTIDCTLTIVLWMASFV